MMWPFKSAEQKRQEVEDAAAYQAAHKEACDRMNAFAPKGTKFNYRGVEMMSLGVWGGFFAEVTIVAEFKTAEGRFERMQFGASSLPIICAENPDPPKFDPLDFLHAAYNVQAQGREG